MSSLIHRGFEYGVIHQLIESPVDLLSFLQNHEIPRSLSALDYIEMGCCYVNHSRILSNLSLQKGDYLRWHSKPRRYLVTGLNLSERICFENENIILLNKPAGLPCHPTVDNVKENVLSILSKQIQKDVFITHRLDLSTQGLLLLAKNKEAQSLINSYFQERKISKIYTAWTLPWIPNNKKLVHYMMPSPRAPKTVSHHPQEGWLKCELEITHSDRKIEKNLLENNQPLEISGHRIQLLTGRTHQIRAQLAIEEHPLLGDVDYQGLNLNVENKKLKIALWSSEIEVPESTLFPRLNYQIEASALDLL